MFNVDLSNMGRERFSYIPPFMHSGCSDHLRSFAVPQLGQSSILSPWDTVEAGAEDEKGGLVSRGNVPGY